MADHRLYLAQVDRPLAPMGGIPLKALLRPLYRTSADGLTWEKINDLVGDFPNRGLVTWLDCDPTATAGTLWQFRVEHYPTYEVDNPHHDRFRVRDTPRPACDVLDLDDGDPDQVRRWVTEDGLQLPFVPASQVILRVSDDLWVGPVQLVALSQPDLWILPPEVCNEPLPCVAPVPDIHLAHVHIGTERVLLGPAVHLSRRGQIDWAPDPIVLARVLKTDLRKLDPEILATLSLTAQAVDRAVASLGAEQLAGVSGLLIERRIQRVQSIIADLQRRSAGLENLAATARALPAVQEELDRLRTDALARAATEAATRERTAHARIAELEAKIARANTELERLDEQRRQRLESGMEALDAALTERLKGLMARPEDTLAEIAIVRAALGMEATQRSTPAPETYHIGSFPFWWQQQAPSSVPVALADPLALVRAMHRALKARQMAPRAARPILAAFLAGAMPVLAGSGTLDALEATASVLAAARLLWVPVSPGTLEPTDLLGRVEPGTERFTPARTGLLDLLTQTAAEALHLVVLDGINHAAAGSYLAPILACLSTTPGTRPERLLPLVHPAAVGNLTPMAEITAVRWPRTVLLGGTLADGITALPLPPSMWSAAALVLLDQFDEEALVSEDEHAEAEAVQVTTDPSALSEVRPAAWQGWRQQLTCQNIEPCMALFHTFTAQGVVIRRDVRQLAARFYAAARILKANEQQAVEEMAIHCLVPALLSTTSTPRDRLRSVWPSNERIERALCLAEQVLP